MTEREEKKTLSERHAELAAAAARLIDGLRSMRLLIEQATQEARGRKAWEQELEMLAISTELHTLVPALPDITALVGHERALYSKERLGDNRRARRRAKLRYAASKTQPYEGMIEDDLE